MADRDEYTSVSRRTSRAHCAALALPLAPPAGHTGRRRRGRFM